MTRALLLTAAAVLALASPAASRETPAAPRTGPNLFIQNLYPGSASVTIRVCNGGTTAAPATYLRVEHFWSPWVWSNQSVHNVATPAINAGSCTNVLVAEGDQPGQSNSWFAYADFFEEMTESDENDNTFEITT
ncbi:MAG TPA: hypothetical protein VF006_30680 [Longimicrobium sp.]